MIQLDISNDYLDYASILDEKYIIIDTIGQGRYAKVKLAVNIEDKQQYAIKIMKNELTQNIVKVQNFVNEVSVQADLQNKNIVSILKCNLSGTYRKFDGRVIYVSYFVMKLAGFGELYEIIEHAPSFSEKLARTVYHQFIEGLEYMHERGVVHRDIKSENILFSKNGTLKIADFGFSTKVFDDKGGRIIFDISNYVGSPEYNPPELCNVSKNKHYSPECADLFASAIVLFTLVMKSAPFKSTTNTDDYYKLFKSNKNAYWKVFQELQQPTMLLRDLLEKMLDENPHKRLTIDQVKKHPWFVGPTLSDEEYRKEIKSKFEQVFNQKKQKIQSGRKLKFHNRRTLVLSSQVEKTLRGENVKVKAIQDNQEILEQINDKLMVRQKIKNSSAQKQSELQKYEEVQKNKNDTCNQQQTQSVSGNILYNSKEKVVISFNIYNKQKEIEEKKEDEQNVSTLKKLKTIKKMNNDNRNKNSSSSSSSSGLATPDMDV